MTYRNYLTIICMVILPYTFSSCIQSEAPNAEADILTCTVSEDILISSPILENDKITLLIKPYIEVDLSNIKLDFTLTPGATIDPPSGTIRDFSSPQTYIVTSESKKWKKEYTVVCDIHGIRTDYDFEHYEIKSGGAKKYHKFYEIIPGSETRQDIWDSGNIGFLITAPMDLPAEQYPTSADPAGKSGYCAKLVTSYTSSLGATFKKPIAAGNLFIGVMDSGISLFGDVRKATHFGYPFNFVPTYLTGYYKYKAGEVFTNKDYVVLPNRKDNFDIYAIVFETDENVEYLDGTNSLTSPNLISIARIASEDRKETDEWTYFSLPFEYLPEKTIDPDKLANNKYKISIIFSSSIDGALFEGAVGSTLMIDEVKLVHSNNEE